MFMRVAGRFAGFRNVSGLGFDCIVMLCCLQPSCCIYLSASVKPSSAAMGGRRWRKDRKTSPDAEQEPMVRLSVELLLTLKPKA